MMIKLVHKESGQIFTDLPVVILDVKIGDEFMDGFLIIDISEKVYLFFYDDSVYCEDVQKKDVTEFFTIEK